MWKGAAIGLLAFVILFWALQTQDVMQGDFTPLEFFAYFAGGLILLGLAGLGCWLILIICKTFPWYFTIPLAAASILLYGFVDVPSTSGTILVFAVALGLPAMLGAAYYLTSNESKIQPKLKKLIGWVGILVCIIGLGVSAFWLFQNNTSDAYENKPTNLERYDTNNDPNPALEGSFTVNYLTYGSGTDIHRPEYAQLALIRTNPVNGSLFIKNWKGLPGWLRSYFWGFDASSLPLNGRIWYPSGDGPFPLVLIVHGNHEMGNFSDKGYEYLAALFASQGFIAVSVDENFLNSSWMDLWSSIDSSAARGWLLLEHLDLWRFWNSKEGNPFYNKVDLNKIALIGHSRGGEAVATAAALNKLPFYPDNALIKFNYNFNIIALAAISPVDGQYKPANLGIPLKNINYFTMHGSYDSDVRSFSGTLQYERVKFDGEDYWFKSTLYILGANHGQFNQQWGQYNENWPESWLLNTSPLIPDKEQKQIAQVYLSAFLKSTLLGKKEYIPLFQDYRFGQKWLPATIYMNQFEDSRAQYIVTNDHTLDITKTAIHGGTITTENLTSWALGKVKLKVGKELKSTQAISWEPGLEAHYIVNIPPGKLKSDTNSVLFINLAEGDFDTSDDDDNASSYKPPIDFSVEISDTNGQKATILLSDFMPLLPQIKAEVYKSDIFEDLPASEAIFQTFQLPIKHFMEINPKLDPKDISTIRFIFNKTASGSIFIGSIGIRNEADKALPQ